MLKPYKVNLNAEHHERLRKMAFRLHTTRSALIRQMVSYYFETMDGLEAEAKRRGVKRKKGGK